MAKHPKNRAHRRFHRLRVIDLRCKRIFSLSQAQKNIQHGQGDGWQSYDDLILWFAKARGRAAKTPKTCSCAMCGNPRRKNHFPGHFGRLTKGEVIAKMRQGDEE